MLLGLSKLFIYMYIYTSNLTILRFDINLAQFWHRSKILFLLLHSFNYVHLIKGCHIPFQMITMMIMLVLMGISESTKTIKWRSLFCYFCRNREMYMYLWMGGKT